MRTQKAACTLLLALAVGACAGSTPPPDSADAPPAQQEPAAPSEAEEPAAASGNADSEKTSAGGAVTDDDVNAILQLVVDDPELDAHLHLEEPGRFPLKVAGDKLPSALKLVKATEPVKVSEPPKSKKDAVLVFTEIEIQGDKATVRYRYDIEGVRGTVTLAKTSHGWELKNSRVVEH